MSRIRTAVVGAGSFGRHHLRILSQSPGAELAGVVDSDAQRAGAAATQHGCPAYASIAELAGKHRLPTMCPYRDYVDAGGLMAYTVDLAELLRHLAADVHQILNGAKPGDIPVYQPTKFELMINQKTAKALGLTLPPTLLSRADELIE